MNTAVDCGEPEAPAHGTVEFEDTHFLSKAHYKCDACYVLNGFNKRSCKPSRQWSKSVPECVLLTGDWTNLYLDAGAMSSTDSS